MLKIGITGSKTDPTEQQVSAFLNCLKMFSFDEFHHRDCIGADAVCAKIVHDNYFAKIICHPPKDQQDRAFFPHNYSQTNPLTHFAGNRELVDAISLLIACPAFFGESKTGGTWYTINYARKMKKPVVIINPDGTDCKYNLS